MRQLTEILGRLLSIIIIVILSTIIPYFLGTFIVSIDPAYDPNDLGFILLSWMSGILIYVILFILFGLLKWIIFGDD